MIRGASLLKDTDSGSSPPELDELRAELIKQKILFEAELRRQREVSDERFDTITRQLQNVLDDNTQLRRTLHAMGDRVQILEHQQQQMQSSQGSMQNQIGALRDRERERASRGRSSSPHPIVHAPPAHVLAHNREHQQKLVEGKNEDQNRGSITSRGRNGTPTKNSNNNNTSLYVKQRPASPAPYVRTNSNTNNNVQQIHGANHQFVKIRPSPATTPRTTTPTNSQLQTPRTARQQQNNQQNQPLCRTGSNVNNNNQQQVTITSPAHIQFRPVLRTAAVSSNNNTSQQNSNVVARDTNNNANNNGGNPFKSPMRQSELSQIGKQAVVHAQRWK